jgi:hypothetical protein
MRQNEQSWILTGGYHRKLWWGYLSHESEGHPGSVDFPYKWVNDREEKTGDVVGFMHTHPGFLASPSLRDDATMAQWFLSFGKPLICLIEGVNGLKGYLYYDDEQPPIPIRTIKRFGQLVVGIMPKKPLPCGGVEEQFLEDSTAQEDLIAHTIDWDSFGECYPMLVQIDTEEVEHGNK